MIPRLAFIRLLLALPAALLLAACDEKPDGWAAIDGPLSSIFAKGCPDLTGTYRLHPRVDDFGKVMSVTIFDYRLPNQGRAFPWETMTISGDARTALVATYARSAETMTALHASVRAWERKVGMNRIAAENYAVMFSPEGRHLPRFAAMSDDDYEGYLKKTFAWPTHSVTVRRGVHYRCSGGWLENMISIEGAPGQREDGKPVQHYSRSASLARDKAGNLVAHHVRMVRQYLTIWCGDGCKGPSLGMWEQHAWGRWAPDQPAWSGPVPRPWAAQQPDPIPVPAAKPEPAVVRMALSAGNLPGRVWPLLPKGVRVGTVGVSGSRFWFMAYTDVQAQVAELMRNLDRSSDFANPELASIVKNVSGRYEAKVFVGAKLTP